jgi:hypothetical protein
VLLLGGYRPVVVHHQAENVRLATRALVAGGATAIEVWSCTDAGFGAEALAAIVDFDAAVPVRVGGTLAGPPPGPKRYWWEHVVAPPWRAPGPADAALAGDCDEGLPGWEETGRFSPYRGSSLLLPREVVTYRRAAR